MKWFFMLVLIVCLDVPWTIFPLLVCCWIVDTWFFCQLINYLSEKKGGNKDGK